MGRGTMPGTVQIRVIADKEQTEQLSQKLTAFLKDQGLEVIECTSDFTDRFDAERRKFHVVAIPRDGQA